jgi:PAS domain S-box-containing protein
MRSLSTVMRYVWLFWASCVVCVPTAWAQTHALRNVLLLHWDDRDNQANIDFDRIFQQTLNAATSGTVEYFSEYLESTRFPGEMQSKLLRNYLRQKYTNIPIDVIVVTTTPALNFLFVSREELFPRTPIVFAGTERPTPAQLSAGAGAAGILYVNSYRKTIELALTLHPGTKQVFVVSGTLTSRESWEAMARKDLESLHAAQVIYLTDLSIDELTNRLASLPENSIVLYVWQRVRNPQGTLLESRDLLSLIAPFVRVPMYGMSAVNVGRGIVGGYVWTQDGNAAKLTEMILKIAAGTRAAEIPLENAPDFPMFDWRELQRRGISEGRLPPGSILRFRELSAWERYRWRIVGAIVVFVLQVLLIAALLVEQQRSRRRARALANTQPVLQESEERFRIMADTTPVMIWVSGKDKLCTFVNRGWLAFTGRALEQELGYGWTESLHPDDRERCFAIYSSEFDARAPFQMEYRLRRADGEYRSVLDSGVARVQADGTFAGYVGTCIDITELKRAQEAALEGQRFEVLALLASGIAHDFNNLLGGILSSTELALTEHYEGAAHEQELLRIKAAAVGGAQIVRELMILGEKQSPSFEPVDCALLIREMVQVLRVSIPKNVTLRTEFADDPAKLDGNPAQIRQLIMNLVLNASQAIGDRGGEIRISASMLLWDQAMQLTDGTPLAKGDYLKLEVTDTGGCISEAIKGRMFDPFFTTKPSGRGLGLAVVQQVVRVHQGSINVASSPGSGTTVQVLLPCASVEQLSASGQQESSCNGSPPADESRPNRLTLLLIEDEYALRIAASKMLQKRGFNVIEAEDGTTGVELFRANAARIDIVLMDLTLPGKSGREVLKELRVFRPDVKVIVASAYGWNQVERTLGELKPSAYVQKPYHFQELEKLLRDRSSEIPASVR